MIGLEIGKKMQHKGMTVEMKRRGRNLNEDILSNG